MEHGPFIDDYLLKYGECHIYVSLQAGKLVTVTKDHTAQHKPMRVEFDGHRSTLDTAKIGKFQHIYIIMVDDG